MRRISRSRISPKCAFRAAVSQLFPTVGGGRHRGASKYCRLLSFEALDDRRMLTASASGSTSVTHLPIAIADPPAIPTGPSAPQQTAIDLNALSQQVAQQLRAKQAEFAAGAFTSAATTTTVDLTGGSYVADLDSLATAQLQTSSSFPLLLGEGQGEGAEAAPAVLEFNGTDDVNDTLSLDLGALPRNEEGSLAVNTIVYNGGANGFDTLKLSGGSFNTVAYLPTGRDSGILMYDDLTIAFTGLEPVVDTSSATVIYIFGTNNADEIHAVDSDPINGADTIKVYEANGGFENITFANKQYPTICALAGDDTVHLDYTHFATGMSWMTVNGGDGNDTIDGGIGPGNSIDENLSGDAGNDTIVGGSGNSLIWGGDGNDLLSGGPGNDTIIGLAGVDTLSGDAGNDMLIGDYWGVSYGDDNYVFDPTTSADGNLGDDIIIEAANSGSDASSDTIDLSHFTADATLDIGNASGPQTVADGVLRLALSDSTGIENVLAGGGNESITGNSRDNVLTGGPGTTSLFGAGGIDTLIGGTGDNTFYAGFQTSIEGGGGNNTFVFDPSLCDYFTSVDIDADPNAANNTLDFSGFGADQPITINLADCTLQQVSSEANLMLTLHAQSSSMDTGIDSVIGGAANDTIYGNSRNNSLFGGDGNDSLFGGAGHDYLFGGNGNDYLYGEAGNDTLEGGAGADYLWGSYGDDVYRFDPIVAADGNLGSDELYENANTGNDTLDFSNFADDQPVNVNLGSASPKQISPGVLWITLSSDVGFENVFGGAGNDTITGNSEDNMLFGGPGNDYLNGGPGDDILRGDDGLNTIDNGEGDGPPEFVGSTSFTVNEGAAPTVIDLQSDFIDASTPSQNLTFEWLDQTGDNPFSSVVLDSEAGTLTVNYDPNSSGQSKLVIRATDSDGDSIEKEFSFTVNFINHAPTTSGLPNITVHSESPTIGIPLWTAFNDVEDDGHLNFTYSLSGDTGALGNVSIDNGLLSATPQVSGTETITVTGTDSNGGTAQTSFDCTVIPTNHVPWLGGNPDTSIDDGNPAFAFKLENMNPPFMNGTIGVNLFFAPGHTTTIGAILTANDADANDSHSFQVIEGPGSVSSIDSTHALLQWSITDGDAGTTLRTMVRVTDDGSPAMHSVQSYYVQVADEEEPAWPPTAYDATYPLNSDGSLNVSAEIGLNAHVFSGAPNFLRTLSIVSPPAHAAEFTVNPDGSFTYLGQPNYYGSDSFRFREIDTGGQQSDVALVKLISHVKAFDDSATLGDPDTPIEIDVLENDYDPLGGPLQVTAVQPGVHDGRTWIAPDGQSVYYLPPRDVQTPGWGDIYDLSNEQTPSDRTSENAEPPGGVTRFSDSFSYTASNAAGESASAFVQIQSPEDPKWKLKFDDDFKKPQQVGMDGKPGYNLRVVQEIGVNPLALQKHGNTETWQKNTETGAVVVKLKTDGKWHAANVGPTVLIDVGKLSSRPVVSLDIHDTLGVSSPPGSVATAFIIEDVSKKLGFNAAGKSLKNLPTIAVQRQRGKGPSADEIATVDAMQGPTLESGTHYIFLDKKLLNEAATERNDPGLLATVKDKLTNAGLNYDNLPDIYERVKVDDLGEWTFPYSNP